MGAASPQKWDPYGEASLPSLFDGRCRAECALGVPRRSQMVGSARRSGPKLQARSAVSRADDDFFEFDVLFYKGDSAAKLGPRPRGVPTLFSRTAAAPPVCKLERHFSACP